MSANNLKAGFRRIRAVLLPLTIILCAIIIGLNCVCYNYSLNMNYMFGTGEIHVSSAKGNELSADYNRKTESSADAAAARMRQLNGKIAEESIVLLKNSGALPLNGTERKLNIFGWYFEGSPYCAPSNSSSSSGGEFIKPRAALEEAGYSVNEELLEAIKNGVPEYWNNAPLVGRWKNDWAIPDYLPKETEIQSALAFSPIAIIWVTRTGTEGADVPQSMNENAFFHNAESVGLSEQARIAYGFDPARHYMQLTELQESLINTVCNAGFEKVLVIINSDNPMELRFVEENPEIDGALLVGGMGSEGFKALPKVLSGEADPSGRLADTYYSDFPHDPTWNNHADLTGAEYTRNGILLSDSMSLKNNVYTNLTPEFISANGLRANDKNMRYVFQNYEEGIYLGYRYYETRGLLEGEGWYMENVVYPFGYGLSYTTFEQYIAKYEIGADAITVEVIVKNIGDFAGKTVIQLYVSKPWGSRTTNPRKIEKSAVELAAFAKSGVLGIGEEQHITLTVAKEAFTSYDDTENGCYVLDDGDYVFSLRENAHTPVINAEEGGVQQFSWHNPHTVIFDEKNPRKSERYAHDQIGFQYHAAVNAFDETLRGISPSFTNMSRADFAGTFPKLADETDQTATDELIAYFKEYEASAMNNAEDTMPATGTSHGLQLIDMRGLDYTDPAWELWLDQWTVEQMVAITSSPSMGIGGLAEYGIPISVNSDGTMGIKYRSIDFSAYGYVLPLSCTACAMARTWNCELCYEFGETCGEEALQLGMNGWYAPALNLHRSPLAGRFFDYFSEDPVLCGLLGSAICSGAGSKGLVTYLKHFALNEGEYLRNYCSVWATEQVMRELYLKPFEIAIKQSEMEVPYFDKNGNEATKTISAVHGIMSSFNRVGNTWSGGNRDLLMTVLREEWGFEGVVISDNMRAEWTDMDLDLMIRGGGDVAMSGGNRKYYEMKSTTMILALRRAVHDISYSVVNSNAMNGIAPGSYISYGLAPWEKCLIAIDVAGGCAIMGLVGFMIYRAVDEKRRPQRYNKSARI